MEAKSLWIIAVNILDYRMMQAILSAIWHVRHMPLGCFRWRCRRASEEYLPWHGRFEHIRFLEAGVDKDHVHFLMQSLPSKSPAEPALAIRSVTARQIFKECPQVRKLLWAGVFSADGHSVASVGRNQNEAAMKEYVKNQGRQDCEYRQLYLNLR